MATYVLPQVLVFQEFTATPAAAANPLRAHISGPHAFLVRYAEDDERALGRLGFYDNLLDTPYEWPNRPAGAVVDIGYVKLWMKNALLQYFSDASGSGSTITKTSGYNNRIRSDSVNFAENGDDFPRDASLLDRDVVAGDIAKVRGINEDGDPVTLWTYVRSLVGDPVDAVVEAASSDDDNPSSSSAAVTVTKIAGAFNCVELQGDASDYDGLPSGDVTETYDVIVTQGSVDGDYTTARLRIISASGRDDVDDVTPAGIGSPTDIGTRGLRATFDVNSDTVCSASAATDDVPPEDLVVGQRWQLAVTGDFTEPSATSSGTYGGTVDTTYIVEVTKGGLYIDDPEISVTTTNGVDISGPTVVPSAGESVDVGTEGVAVSFTGLGLRKGDKYYIVVTAEAEGPKRTIVLGHNLDTEIPADSEVDLTLYILKPLLQIDQERSGFAPLLNWDTSETEITVNSGIIAYDSSWTDEGTPEALDVLSESSKGYGELFVEYRAWRSDLCNDVSTIQDSGELDDSISGALHPDNPLKWGVFKALQNANGTEVKFTSVCDPDDLDSWTRVLELLLGRDDVYGLVPLTRNVDVLGLYQAHVDAQSTPEQALWRVLWTNLAGIDSIPIVSTGSQSVPNHSEPTTTDGEVALGVIEDDPNTSGTQYTILRCTTANADFLTNDVQPGDIVRALFTGDGFGDFTYSEFIVDEVQSEDELRLLSGPAAPVNVGAKFEIWRTLTATEEAAELALVSGTWGNRRVMSVWPDRIDSGGTIQEGYFLCCALAGLASGVVPQQGLTNLEISGFTSVPRTTRKFNRTQLNTMALAGTWIVTQDLTTGNIFTRHAVTTGDYNDINVREEMITRNVDSISYRFKDQLAPFIGVSNVTPTTTEDVRVEIRNTIEVLKTEKATQRLGGQLLGATIDRLEEHAVFKDRLVAVLGLDVPVALNNIELHLVV